MNVLKPGMAVLKCVITQLEAMLAIAILAIN